MTCLRIVIPILLAALTATALADPTTDSDGPASNGNGRAIDPTWRYNPWTGEAIDRDEDVPDRTPVEVLRAFFDGYRRRDKEVIGDCLALERILADIVNQGIDRTEGLTPKVRKVLKEKMVKESTRRLAPVVLDVMVSPEMMKEYPPPDRKDIAMIGRLYKQEVIGDTARLIPGSGLQKGADIIVLERIDGRWKITRLPGIMGRR